MKNNITCSECHATLDVEQVIKEQLEKDYNASFNQKKAALEKEFNEREQSYQQKESLLAEEKARQDRVILEKLKAGEIIQRAKIEKELIEKNSAIIKSLEKENQEKQAAIKEMQTRELDLLRQQKQIEEQREALELQVERTLAQERKSIEEKAREKEKEANFLKSQENDHLINSLKQQLENMQRKMEQGSTQVQGEVMEVELEKLLAQTFPFDEITSVGKGANGADILHKVRNHQMADCGTIIF